MALFEQYCEYYKPLLKQFCSTLTTKFPAERFAGIPRPHLPVWGKRYKQSLVKLAIIGKETCCYDPHIDKHIVQVQKEMWNSVFESKVTGFQDFDFVEHRCFWDGILDIFAKLYGFDVNWNILSHPEQYTSQYQNVLNSFVWGEATAIEDWKSHGICKGVADQTAWDIARVAATTILNDFQHLQKLFAPQVTIILCRPAICNRYLHAYFHHKPPVLIWEEKHRNKYPACLWNVGDGLIFNIPHPQNGYQTKYFAERIRNSLIEQGYFQPFLPFMDCDEKSQSLLNLNVFRRGIPDGTDVRDAIAYIATELCKQNACMTPRLLIHILKQLGYKTKDDHELSEGRGSYNLIRLACRRYREGFQMNDVADAIANAFSIQK